MGLVFCGVALVAVALCGITLLMQRNEHRKLLVRIEERDSKVAELSERVDASAREAEATRKARKAAEDALDGYKRGAEAVAQRMEDEKAQLEQEKQNLQDELDQVKTQEERLNDEARNSLQKSAVGKLPMRKPDDAPIDTKTTFRPTVDFHVAGALPAQIKPLASKAAESSLANAKVPLSEKLFRAYVEGRVHGRTSQVDGKQWTAVSIEASLMTPCVSTTLDGTSWTACITEMEVFLVQDSASLEQVIVERTGTLVGRLLERGLKGGPAGQLANQPMPPSAGSQAAPGAGSASPGTATGTTPTTPPASGAPGTPTTPPGTPANPRPVKP